MKTPINTSANNQLIAFFTSHPRGLYTLFFTEIWERFSYYGMRALLILFMTSPVIDGGLDFDDATATAIYGLYTASVYCFALPGGWIADRFTGAQSAVWYGGVVIAAGHFILALPITQCFYLGLIFVAIGTGLLKPNISAIVGELYPRNSPARDSGYTIFYMGINIGSMAGPLICASIAGSDLFGWHFAFAAAGVGMLFGLLQYRLNRHHLGNAGLHRNNLQPAGTAGMHPLLIVSMICIFVLLSGITVLFTVTEVDVVFLAQLSTYTIATLLCLFFLFIFIFGNLTEPEKNKMIVIVVLIIASAIFWSGFEQMGSSFNLFAERYTHRVAFGYEIPAGWFQSLNPLFILLLAPVFAGLWINLGKRNLDPSIPVKFSLGLLQLSFGFFIMYMASKLVIINETVLPTWLMLTYLFHTTAELCLSPVGLSSISKLSPKRFSSQMMGIWYMSLSMGNIIAGLFAGRFDPNSLHDMPGLYAQIVYITFAAGALLFLLRKPLSRMISNNT